MVASSSDCPLTEEQQESQTAKFSGLKRNEKSRRAPGDQDASGLMLFALELALKAYLVDAGTPEKTLKRAEVRHNLKVLHDLAAKAGLHFGNPDVVAVIDDYRDDHKDHSFRYGGRDYVDLGGPDQAFRTLSATVNEIGKVLKQRL
jgi:hypothetical protein